MGGWRGRKLLDGGGGGGVNRVLSDSNSPPLHTGQGSQSRLGRKRRSRRWKWWWRRAGLGGRGSAPVRAGHHRVGGGGSDALPSSPPPRRDGRGADEATPPLKVKQRGDRQAELMAAATLSGGRTDGRSAPARQTIRC